MLAVLIAALALALVLSAELLIDSEPSLSFADGVLTWVVIAGYALVVAVPFAVVGVPVVHVVCRRVPWQLAHVLVTGTVTLAEFAVPFGRPGVGAGAVVAMATMAGRAAVIPLVRMRRERVRRELDAFERSNREIPVA